MREYQITIKTASDKKLDKEFVSEESLKHEIEYYYLPYILRQLKDGFTSGVDEFFSWDIEQTITSKELD